MTETLRFLLPIVQIEDPHTCTDSHAMLTIRRLLFQGLVSYDGRGATAVLARSWECGDGGRSWTFHLREGMVFSSGKELSAKDVVYSLKRAASPEREGRLFTVTYSDYIGKARIEAAGPHTVRLHNPEPIADLLEFLPDLSIIPEGWGSYGDGTGTGPYTLEAGEPGRAILRPRDNSGPRRHLEFREEKDPVRRAAAVAEGRADYALDPPPEIFAASESRPAVPAAAAFEVYPWNTSLCVIFLIRCDLPPFDDPRVRRAFNLLVDKDRIIREVLYGRGRPLNGPLSDRHFGADPDLPPYPFDPAGATALLREAGMEKGFTLNIHAPLIIPDEGPRLAHLVAEQLGAAGIETRVVLHEDRTEYARKIALKELDGISCFDSSPPGTYKVLKEKLDSRARGTWWQGYHNDEFNRLLSKASETAGDGARRETYRRAYGILRDDAPWLFLYSPVRSWIGRPGESGGEPEGRVSFDSLGFPAVR
jgi:peptide/nickel transport system substrate-binding protein